VVPKGEAGAKRGYLSRATMAQIIKEAHAECAKEVPVKSHKTPAGRTRLGKDRNEYLGCLRRKVQTKVYEKLKALGVNVAPPM
jgi:hypothetical protein